MPMRSTAPTQAIHFSDEHGEVQFSIGGLWGKHDMDGFLAKLDDASLPLVKQRRRIHVLGDMREFMAQSQDTGDAIRDHLMKAKKFGLEKVAILTDSAMVKLQYRRLSSGINVEFFSSKGQALVWLRS